MTSTKGPPLIHEHGSGRNEELDNPAISPSCPFCTIALAFPPVNPLDLDSSNQSPAWNPEKLSPPSYVLLTTQHVVAFLDIAPLTRGHVLVSPRRHRTKVGDMLPDEMSEIGRLLPIIARSVIRAVLPDIPHHEADYNIVQNNGPGAAQVVPHVHFHIVPRPPLNYQPVSPQKVRDSPPKLVKETARPVSLATDGSVSGKSPSISVSARKSSKPAVGKYPPSKIPTGLRKSYVQFGRGARHELDEDEAAPLIEEMRRCIAEEWRKTFGDEPTSLATESQPLPQTDRHRRGKL